MTAGFYFSDEQRLDERNHLTLFVSQAHHRKNTEAFLSAIRGALWVKMAVSFVMEMERMHSEGTSNGNVAILDSHFRLGLLPNDFICPYGQWRLDLLEGDTVQGT